ncbi:hypothetical protein [Mesorhizobium kowhaii]|uniref:Uncharacterized protein n=1 Tax=Mesorhizobium kowhaii TaxID=1300272 RepID=A0A2W7CTL4_9HYPH|nr:hypothetical protein [Mesorhizobium kowhaii]PZV37099.1 hypothetical protein B5V02_17875 [Mesorhizobium kowhaii]
MRTLHYGQIHCDLPNTSLPRDLRAWLGELASEICRRHLAPPETAHPTRQSRPPVLVTVKDQSLRDGLQPPLTVTARGGQFEARSARGDDRQSAERGDEETNQEQA